MSTAPVTPAPSKLNGFESFFTKFGTVLKDIANVAVNIGEQEAAVIEPLLPPTIAAGLAKVLSAAATQVAAADAKYAAIGQSNVPYAVKVAEAVAVGGEGILALATQAGLTIASGQLSQFIGAAGTIASTINLTGLTNAPVPQVSPAKPE